MKKGFTLIEVLAVVVVLSAVFAIVVPKINQSINARNDAEYTELVASIENAAKLYVSDNYLIGTDPTPRYLTMEDLVENNYLPYPIKDPRNDENFNLLAIILVTEDEDGVLEYEFSIDNIFPVVNSITKTSSTSYEPYLKIGDTLTVNIVFNKTIANTPTVTIGGYSATVSGNGTTRTASLVVPSGYALNGYFTVVVSNYEDVNGVIGEPTTYSTNVTPYLAMFNTATPVASSFTIGSGNPTYSKTTGVTLYMSATNALQMCISTSTTCTAWETYATTKTYTLATGDGTKTLYVKFRNSALEEVSANDSIILDTTAPVCTTSGGSPDWFNTNRTITGTCTDTGGSGCVTGSTSYPYEANTNTTTAGPGTNGAAWVAYDNAGNTATCLANQTVKIDKTAPTCVSSGGSTTWTKTSRVLTGTCSDTGGSTCTSATITKTYSTNTNSTTESPGTVTDVAGNSVVCPANQTVKVDVSKPTYTSLAATSTASTITLTVTGGADALSGVASYDYYLNGTKITNSTSASYTYTGLSSGTSYTVSFDIIDNSGNKETGSTTKATVVNIPTSLTATNNTACQGKQITVSWNANGNSSGTSYVVYVSTDNVTFTELATTTSTSYVHTGLTTELVRYYKVKAKNITTSVESALTASVTGRTLASPVVTATKNGTLNSGTINIALSWTAVPGAASYGITIFDGRAYRTHNIGNVTSWNSNAANIYPTAAQIAAWNLTDDPFRWNGDGVDFASNVNALYLKANGGYTSYTYYTWVHVHAYDSAGRESGGVWAGAYSVSGANMDTDSPTATAHNPKSRDWASTNISITISATDINTGTLSYQSCYTTNGTTCTPSTAGGTVALSATGQYTVCSRAIDVAGNTGPTTCSAANAYKIDKTNPTYTSIAATSTVNSITLTITGAADSNSGISSYKYYLNGTLIVTNTSSSYTYTGLTANTTYTVSFEIYDVAGNKVTASTTKATLNNVYTWNKYYANSSVEYYNPGSFQNFSGGVGYGTYPSTHSGYTSDCSFDSTSGFYGTGSEQTISTGMHIYKCYGDFKIHSFIGNYNSATDTYDYMNETATCNTSTTYSQGSYIGQVTSTNSSAYPLDGESGGYWYIRQ